MLVKHQKVEKTILQNFELQVKKFRSRKTALLSHQNGANQIEKR